MKYFTLITSLLFFAITSIAQIPEMTENTKSVMSSILLNEMELMDYENIEAAILSTWDIGPDKLDGNNQTISFEVDGITYLAAMIPVAMPGGGLETAVEYSYLWKDARTALNNKSHIAIAVIGESEAATLYTEATKLTALILEYSNASGVFLANQSLVLSREYYLAEVAKLSEGNLPINLWVYFGHRQNEKGSSVYTYGMQEFGLEELEIVDSQKSHEEISSHIKNTALDLITGKSIIDTGEEVDEGIKKLDVILSNGVNTDRLTYKLEY